MAYAGKAGETRRLRALHKPASRGPLTTSMTTPRPVGALATGLAIGLLVGGAVALLFAPQRGADTRQDLRRGLRRARRSGHDAWEDLRWELRQARRRLSRLRRGRQVELDESIDS